MQISKSLENRIPPPLVALIFGAAMWLAARFTPVISVHFRWRLCVAIPVAALALAISIAGVRAFRRARTTLNPVKINEASTLVTTGIYRRTRNPMYLGLTILLTAWTIYLAAPVALLGPILLVLYLTRFQIIPEERAMHAKFGDAYVEYQRSVRRWI